MSNLPVGQNWQALYRKALAETDPQKLLPLVISTETAIFYRSQELMHNFDANTERKAIADALRGLRTIQIEKLNFPE